MVKQNIKAYSTENISQKLLEEISTALKSVSPFGSVEIYVTDGVVSQVTTRNIKKTISTKEYNHKQT